MKLFMSFSSKRSLCSWVAETLLILVQEISWSVCDHFCTELLCWGSCLGCGVYVMATCNLAKKFSCFFLCLIGLLLSCLLVAFKPMFSWHKVQSSQKFRASNIAGGPAHDKIMWAINCIVLWLGSQGDGHWTTGADYLELKKSLLLCFHLQRKEEFGILKKMV